MPHPEVAAIPDNQNCCKDLGAIGIKTQDVPSGAEAPPATIPGSSECVLS